MQTYDIHELAALLKCDESTAYDLAQRGEIVGARVGRAWVFMDEHVADYLRKTAAEQTAKRIAELEDRYKKVREQQPIVALPPGRRQRRRTPPVLPQAVVRALLTDDPPVPPRTG